MSMVRGPDANWGHPVAYHPALAHFFGSVNAGIFFDQLTYWDSRTQNPLGVYKKAEEWELETGLSYREQATARRILSEPGYLIETNKRLEHRLYFLIDWDAFNPAFRAWSEVNRPATNRAAPDCGKRISPNDENAFRGVPNRHPSIEAETTAEITPESTAAESAGALPPPPMAGAVCNMLKALGMQGVAPSNAKLKALIADGVDLTEFITVGKDCIAKQKNFGYLLATIEGRKADMARLTEQALAAPASRVAPTAQPETFKERDARLQREEWERSTGKQWPEQDLPASARRQPAPAPYTLEAETRRIA